MAETSGSILLADDDPGYAATMAELLTAEGYDVTVAATGDEAVEVAGRKQFDLLLADLEMPGNEDLALVRSVARTHGNLPIIIVTGYPSIRTTLACIELPVSAYLLKPVAFDALLERVRAAVTRYRTWRKADERLDQVRADLAHASAPAGGTGTGEFLRLALRNVMGSLSDVEEVAGRTQAGVTGAPHTCQVLNCPRGAQLAEAVREAIYVLEETRSSFKSTQLRDLRRKLALMLEHQ